jgi:xanthine/CO dehydrogenase XdhC/CoxF family maturation factor
LADGLATAEQLAAVRAPIGVRIGAVSPEEIALSIAAELTAVRRGEPLASAQRMTLDPKFLPSQSPNV